jgi:hypothetical protein
VEAFCFTPVIACLFFVASVLSMLEMQVSMKQLQYKLLHVKMHYSSISSYHPYLWLCLTLQHHVSMFCICTYTCSIPQLHTSNSNQ